MSVILRDGRDYISHSSASISMIEETVKPVEIKHYIPSIKIEVKNSLKYLQTVLTTNQL